MWGRTWGGMQLCAHGKQPGHGHKSCASPWDMEGSASGGLGLERGELGRNRGP